MKSSREACSPYMRKATRLQSLRSLRFTFDRRFSVQTAPSELHPSPIILTDAVGPPTVDWQVLKAAINRLNFALRAAYSYYHSRICCTYNTQLFLKLLLKVTIQAQLSQRGCAYSVWLKIFAKSNNGVLLNLGFALTLQCLWHGKCHLNQYIVNNRGGGSMAPFNRLHMSFYWRSRVNMALSYIVSKSDILVENRCFCISHLHSTSPLRGIPSEFCRYISRGLMKFGIWAPTLYKVDSSNVLSIM